MKQVIWKFQFDVEDFFEISMPKDAQILTVQNQNETGTMWAIVNPNNETVKRCFVIHGTGHGANFEGKTYIGTYQTDDGQFVWHLFEFKK